MLSLPRPSRAGSLPQGMKLATHFCRVFDSASREGPKTVLAGTMNFCGNMAGVIVPSLIGLIVQFTGSYFLVLIFFVVMAMLLAIFSSLIDYRERGLA